MWARIELSVALADESFVYIDTPVVAGVQLNYLRSALAYTRFCIWNQDREKLGLRFSGTAVLPEKTGKTEPEMKEQNDVHL